MAGDHNAFVRWLRCNEIRDRLAFFGKSNGAKVASSGANSQDRSLFSMCVRREIFSWRRPPPTCIPFAQIQRWQGVHAADDDQLLSGERPWFTAPQNFRFEPDASQVWESTFHMLSSPIRKLQRHGVTSLIAGVRQRPLQPGRRQLGAHKSHMARPTKSRPPPQTI
jgi:hypothetical protein